MKTIVFSLGGSLIIPNSVNYSYLHALKKVLLEYKKEYRFVLVCGGGNIAREYIGALRKEGTSQKGLAEVGIGATRMNAKFLMKFFGETSNSDLPKSMLDVKNTLKKKSIVICGALHFESHATTDSTAAKLAQYLNCSFVNLTNVEGLYTQDPKVNPRAKLIEMISWKDFEKMATSKKYEAGQHFILDQDAAGFIKKHTLPCVTLGINLKNLKNYLDGKRFIGTTIGGFDDNTI